jgi:hypothetical protein
MPKKTNLKDLFAESFPEAAKDAADKITFVPEVKKLTNAITFALIFGSISPAVLVLLNLCVVNIFHGQPISDPVVITFIAASSLSTILQPIVSRILEKTVEKAGIS